MPRAASGARAQPKRYSAVIFDMDGVLADVRYSYRAAIAATVGHFTGKSPSQDEISERKRRGGCNNDWELSLELCRAAGAKPTFDEVRDKFEEFYQANSSGGGFARTETLIPSAALIRLLARQTKVAVATGRPRKDCTQFLEQTGLSDVFNVAVCMEDGPAKPDPFVVRRAAELLGVPVRECLMIGDTVDDVRAAVQAQADCWGVLTPEEFAKTTLALTPERLAREDRDDAALVDSKSGAALLQAGATRLVRPGLPELAELCAAAQSTAPLAAPYESTPGASRVGRCARRTAETQIEVELSLPARAGVLGSVQVSTGVGFFDHMLTALCKHGGISGKIACTGDLEVCDHHTVEDVGLAMGTAIDAALGDRKDITRFGMAQCPLDEALARAVVDVSSRPSAHVDLKLQRETIGNCSCEMLEHFFESFASTARLTLHVDVLKGKNDHHKAEAAFKSAGRAMRQAFATEAGVGVPSTKGVL